MLMFRSQRKFVLIMAFRALVWGWTREKDMKIYTRMGECESATLQIHTKVTRVGSVYLFTV